MKSNISIKIQIGISVFIISLIYFSFFNFLYGRLVFPLLPSIFYSFVAVFVYPYIKIDSRSLLKRSLFFGIIIWIVNLPQVLMDLRETLILMTPGFPNVFSFIVTPLYFIILGLILGFCYKKFFPEEFNLPLQKLKIPFAKISIAVVLVILIYSIPMYFSEIFLYKNTEIYGFVRNYIISPLDYRFYITPLIYALIFALLYIKTFRRANISKNKKWILFSLFITFFITVPTQISEYLVSPTIGLLIIPLIRQYLFIPHLLSIFLIGYIFTRLLNGSPITSKFTQNHFVK